MERFFLAAAPPHPRVVSKPTPAFPYAPTLAQPAAVETLSPLATLFPPKHLYFPFAPTLVRTDPLNFPAENLTADFSQGIVTPNQLRWKPFPFPSEKVDWVRSLFTICGSGR